MAKNTILFKLLGDSQNLVNTLNGAEGRLSKFAKNAGKVGALAVVAAGAGVVKLGIDLDKAIDNIIVGTGASGDALDGLTTSFENVASNVPNSFGDVSTAIADVNTRLGLTGKPLEDLSTQFLDLSRLTGTDVATNVANMSRVFGDAGIATEDQSLALDTLFKASQASGIGLDQLSTSLVSFGAPMRALGFSFEESTALLSKFELEGVNTEAVMAGMKIGLGKMAKAGEEPIDTFDRVVESIANAGTAGEANALALEAFGQRAGPDMAAAIREGRFEIGDMMGVLEDSEGAIGDTADATESWTEKLKILANKAMIKIAPLAEKAFGAIEDGVAAATPYVEAMVDWLSERLPPVLATLRRWLNRTREVLVSAFSWISDNRDMLIGAFSALALAVTVALVPAFVAWAVSAGAAAVATLAAAAPFIAIGVAIAAVGAALVWAYQNVDWFRDAVDKTWQVLQGAFAVALDVGKKGVDLLWGAIETAVDWLKTAWDESEGLRSLIAGGLKLAFDAAKKYIDIWRLAITTAVTWVQTAWTKTESLRSLLASGLKLAFDAAKTYIDTMWKAIQTAASWLQSAWTKTENLRSLLATGFKTAFDAAKTYIDTMWKAIQKAASWLQSAWTKTENLRSLMADGFKTAIDNGRRAINTTWAAVKTLAGWIQTAWDKSDTLRSLLAGSFKTAVNGIKSAFNFAKTAANNLASAIQKIIDKAGSAASAVSSIPGAGAIGGIIGGVFHDGGYVGGSPNAAPKDIPIMAQGGEYVMSRAEVAAAKAGANVGGSPSGSGGGTPVHIHLFDKYEIEAIVSARDAELLRTIESGIR